MDLTRITLGELISHPDTIVQRHAHGIVKRLKELSIPRCPQCGHELHCYVPDCKNEFHSASPLRRP